LDYLHLVSASEIVCDLLNINVNRKLIHSRKKIEFILVPSHTGIIDNELADNAVNEAVNK